MEIAIIPYSCSFPTDFSESCKIYFNVVAVPTRRKIAFNENANLDDDPLISELSCVTDDYLKRNVLRTYESITRALTDDSDNECDNQSVIN